MGRVGALETGSPTALNQEARTTIAALQLRSLVELEDGLQLPRQSFSQSYDGQCGWHTEGIGDNTGVAAVEVPDRCLKIGVDKLTDSDGGGGMANDHT